MAVFVNRFFEKRVEQLFDLAGRREDLGRIAEAVKPYGLEYRHIAGVDMLIQTGEPSARRAVHLVFSGEKVRQDYAEPVPDLGSARTIHGIRLMPLGNLIRMKLTSFCAKDEAHLKDLDDAGLITAEIEQDLPDLLRERLRRVRARD